MFAVIRLALRTSLPILLMVGPLALASSSPDDRAASAGSWDVVAVVMNGRPVDHSLVSQIRLTLRDDGAWVVLFKGEKVGEGTSEKDPEATPKAFEMETLGDTKTPPRKYAGIYRLEGDIQQFCFTIAGSPRPDDFTSPRGSGRILVTLKRAGERGIEQ